MKRNKERSLGGGFVRMFQPIDDLDRSISARKVLSQIRYQSCSSAFSLRLTRTAPGSVKRQGGDGQTDHAERAQHLQIRTFSCSCQRIL